MTKIAIIGCGYVGFAIASFWKDRGHKVTVTTTTPEKVTQLNQVAQKVVVLQGDDLNSLKEVVKDQEVILLCVGFRNRANYSQTYLGTAKNLILAVKEDPSLQQLIYTSSYSVLGDKQGAWADENSAVNPLNENSQILAETEEILLKAQKESLKVCILRLAGIYGEGRELIKIFRSWAGTTRPGNGEDYTNWVHLKDIVGGIELSREQQLTGVYNLTGDRPLLRKEFFQRLFATHNLPSLIWDASIPSTRSYNLRLSNTKIKNAGLQLQYPEIRF
jgi:nucleoside-diphosphate-sugar epimerase